MHLGMPALLDFYRNHLDDDALVLVTIVDTEGSTYRKPGAMMLISHDGRYEGMISGGCLEGDLLHHASAVFADGEPKFVTYDMHAGEDMVWSLGLGCDGVIHLLLQRLDRKQDFGFLRQLESSLATRRAALIALVTHSAAGWPPGTAALLDRSGIFDGEEKLLGALKDATENWPTWRYRRISVTDNVGVTEAILINCPPQTRVLICGAGPDAVPVVRVLAGLDWDVQIIDHRPAYASAHRFPANCTVTQSRPEGLSDVLDLKEFDAVVIMSHHLEHDAEYLRQVTRRDIEYIGVLGPRARRDRLQNMADCPDRQVFGPVGLDIGAELPEAIALSVAAEIHAVLNGRSGVPLTPVLHEGE